MITMQLTYEMEKSNPLASISSLNCYTYHESDEGKLIMRESYLVPRKNTFLADVIPRRIKVIVDREDIEG